jgi:DNA-binding NarL/FixJ family response regulator
MNTLLQPILYSGAVAIAAAAATYFLLLRKTRAALADRTSNAEEASEGVRLLQTNLEKCQQRLDELERRQVPVVEGFAVPASVHLNRRGQVGQLHRRGESARNIASTLGISQGEVKLMIKLQDLNRSGVNGFSKENLSKVSSDSR